MYRTSWKFLEKSKNFQKTLDKPPRTCYNKDTKNEREEKKVLERLHDGEFVGMDFEDVLVELAERGIVPTVVEEPEEDCLGGITVGSIYLNYYEIEFDEMGICDCCYHGTCEE